MSTDTEDKPRGIQSALHLDDDPVAEFQKWYDLAAAKGSLDFDAMTLATASKSGVPHARTVLFKGWQQGAIKFYTNYKSAKGKELTTNSRAALLFYWSALYRQVRLEGRVKKMSRESSEKYFEGRPRDSQLGAWASDQSSKIKSLEYLDEKFDQAERKFSGKIIPCPPYWGGFLFYPEKIEFWMGRSRRLHHRVRYELKKENGRAIFSVRKIFVILCGDFASLDEPSVENFSRRQSCWPMTLVQKCGDFRLEMHDVTSVGAISAE